MSTAEKSTFQFRGFKIVESHIVKKEDEKVGSDIKIGFNPRGEIDKANSIYRVLLGVEVKDEEGAFYANIEAIGYFHFSDSIEQEMLHNMFYTNAPAILFPYIRAYISTLTNLSGAETVTLPTINLSSIGGALKENTVEF